MHGEDEIFNFENEILVDRSPLFQLLSSHGASDNNKRDLMKEGGCGTCHGTCNEELKRQAVTCALNLHLLYLIRHLPRCDCVRGFTRKDCSEPVKDLNKLCKRFQFRHDVNCSGPQDSESPLFNSCLNDCNQRGECLSGWCHCLSGYYGGDCSLSLGSDGRPALLEGLGYTLRQKRPHIYVYELPPSFNTHFNLRVQDRPLWFMFQQRLLGVGARTPDGDSADYYFIPMSIRNPSDSLLMVQAVAYIRKHWPWWDRLDGARHIFLHTGDTGRMDMTLDARRVTTNSTWITHWGLYQDYPYSGWKAAHRPGVDIVAPILIGSASPRAGALKHSPLHPLHPDRSPGAEKKAKSLEVLFAGRICGGREEPNSTRWPNCRDINRGYSQGVRQRMHFHHWNRSGYRISTTNKNYLEDLASTRFCLAPTGGGHGHRQILVAFSGCVPLLIGDYVYQPFEPEVDWNQFSVTVKQSDIHRLHEILGDISEEQYRKLEKNLRCGAEHMTYSSFLGSFKWDRGRYDAFETTLEILRSRLKHPGLEPHMLAEKDEEFKAFMECREVGPEEPEEPSKRPNELCSFSTLDSVPAECEQCFKRHHGIIPGGASCCESSRDITKCRRAWE